MKALFLGLLLANILFFAWASWHAPAEPGEAPAPAGPVRALKLAGEDPRGADTPRTATRATEQTSANTPRCMTLGPFYDLPEASRASAFLRGSGHESRTRVAEGDIWAGLWVYLEDLPSRADAQRTMATLQENGITDTYLLPATAQGVGISLGIFSEPPRAQRRAAQVRKLGFSPTIAERTRKGTIYWLDIALPRDGGTIDPLQLAGVEGSSNGRIVRVEVKSCPAPSAE